VRLDAWIRGHRFLMDALMAGILCLFLAVPSIVGGTPLPFLWSVALLAPLAWRRTRPVISSATVCGVALLQWTEANSDRILGHGAGDYSQHPLALIAADVAVPITVHAATCYAPVWARRTALTSGIIGAFLQAVQFSQPVPESRTLVFLFGVFSSPVVGAWAIGSMRRARLDHVDSLRERARLLEVERDQKARLAVTAERARIAREMHDVVAHSLAVMIAQADGGRYSVRSAPDAAEQVLQTIGETGRKALAEMRQLLAVLRTDLGESWEPDTTPPSRATVQTAGRAPAGEAPAGRRNLAPGAVLGRTRPLPGNGPDGVRTGATSPVRAVPTAQLPAPAAPGPVPARTAGAPQLRPQPRLADLERLVDDVRASGQRVELRVTGPVPDVVPGIELAAYRIVQESLTNVLKHAGPGASTRIHLGWSTDVLEIEVVDDGRGAGAAVVSDGRGMGLMGMQERAAVFGGNVEAGPVAGGGFRVAARIPVLTDLIEPI